MSLTLQARSGEARSLAAALRRVMADAMEHHACVECHLTEDLTDPDALRYAEEWNSDDDLRARVASPAFSRLIAIIEAARRPPALKVEFIAQTLGLDYVERIRQEPA